MFEDFGTPEHTPRAPPLEHRFDRLYVILISLHGLVRRPCRLLWGWDAVALGSGDAALACCILPCCFDPASATIGLLTFWRVLHCTALYRTTAGARRAHGAGARQRHRRPGAGQGWVALQLGQGIKLSTGFEQLRVVDTRY